MYSCKSHSRSVDKTTCSVGRRRWDVDCFCARPADSACNCLLSKSGHRFCMVCIFYHNHGFVLCLISTKHSKLLRLHMEKLMNYNIPGIHHVTAICDNAQQNIDFYAGMLGLRLIKQTVNFDMPDTYHLYYGDEQGHPGTILTFFSWPDSPKGYIGTGQIGTIAFSIPEKSLDYWEDRLSRHNILVGGPNTRFDEKVLSFMAPEGLVLELIAHAKVQEH